MDTTHRADIASRRTSASTSWRRCIKRTSLIRPKV
jgi:hypothetical protein